MIHLLEALPLTGSGKVLKSALREAYRTPSLAAAPRPVSTVGSAAHWAVTCFVCTCSSLSPTYACKVWAVPGIAMLS